MNTIKNENGQLRSVEGPVAVDAFRLRVLASGLKFEIKCPNVKFMKGGVLKAAKRITGLKTNDKAKHLARVEEMLNDAVSQCEVVSV